MDRLAGVIKPYDWGQLDALADMLGHPAPGHPEAEYWLGAHPGGPATLESSGTTLDVAIARSPIELLGPEVAERFGGLPFLVKLLAARQALSIQTHPSAAQAAAGYAREEAGGPARDAPDRNYRDANHKPELICALTPFEARCGFRPAARTDAVLGCLGPALDPVRQQLASVGPAATATWLLGLDGPEAAHLARTTVAAASDLLARATVAAASDLVATGTDIAGIGAEAEATVAIGQAFPDDVGVVVALLLNHVVLEPGQALFLEAGTLHAYLNGFGVEVMANSDNVVRGGLTSKHVDVDELVAIVDDRTGPAPVQTPDGPDHTYASPVPEFEVTRLDGAGGTIDTVEATPTGPEIVLVTDGSVEVVSASARLTLARGQAGFVSPADGPYRLVDRAPGRSMVWRVTVGSPG